MIKTVSLYFLLTLFSCGAPTHLRLAKHHLKRAELKGAKLVSDTTYKNIKLRVQGISVMWMTVPVKPNERMLFIKDSVRTEIRIKHFPGRVDSIEVATKCPDKVVEAKIPIAVHQTIKAGFAWWHLLACLCIGIVIGFIVGKLM